MFNLNFKPHSTREFKYKPRYYDEQKEAIKQKVRQRTDVPEDSTEIEKNELRKERLSQAFSKSRNVQQKQEEQKVKLSAQLRRLVILFILFLGIYWVASQYLVEFINYLTKGSLEVKTEQLDSYENEEDLDPLRPIRHY